MAGNPVQLIASAKRSCQQGRWQEAAEFARQAIASEHSNVEARLVFGITQYQLGDLTASLTCFEEVLQLDAKSFVALNWASMLCRTQGNPEIGAGYAQRALTLQPNNPEAAFNLGICIANSGNASDALRFVERAVRAQPNRPQYLYALATLLIQLLRKPQAIDVLLRAISLEPTEDGFVKLIDAQIATGQLPKALESAEKAVQLLPTSAPVQIMLAQVHAELGDENQAAIHLDKALELEPDRVEAHVQKGNRAQVRGDFEGAERSYRRAIEIEPNQGVSYFGITLARKLTEDDRLFIDQMRAQAADMRMPMSQRPLLLFALAKAYDNLGEYASAIRFYDEGNAIQKQVTLQNRPFNAVKCHREVDRRIDLYGPELFEKLKPAVSNSDVPVFVLGMMRSGTTLVEQILSCHPDIGGAGELAFWASREEWYVDLDRRTVDLPAISKGSHEFVEHLRSKAPGHKLVTDKNPANVMAAGLIHAALPNAKIIHTIRDPADTALSMWITMVQTPPDFYCDRENIVTMYREYTRLANHWRATLPHDRFIEVHYEDLIQNPEPQIRRLLSFLGVEWDERCLHPENNDRRVTTPSLWQVRQPFFSNSAGRWKRYQEWIPEFIKLREELMESE